MTSAQKQEFARRVTQAGPGGMIIILYEIELVYLDDAKKALEAGDDAEFRKAIHLTQEVIQHQRENLHFQFEPAWHLLELYLFFHKQLTQALAEKKFEPIDHVAAQITKLRDAYAEALDGIQEEPMMEHTQEVIAGLTYGKDSLNEDLLNYDPQRGFKA